MKPQKGRPTMKRKARAHAKAKRSSTKPKITMMDLFISILRPAGPRLNAQGDGTVPSEMQHDLIDSVR